MPNVFITGGGGTIGPGIVRSFAKAGYNVAASYNRSKESTVAVLEEVEKEYGVKTLAVQGNNGVVEDIYRMFKEVRDAFGGIDAMVNNAGLTFSTNLLTATEEDFNHGVNIDFRGTFFCMQQAANNMIDHGIRGAIINISSNHQVVTFGTHSMLYAASKAAIDRMTKSASVELAPYGIRVAAIAPGYTGEDGVNEKWADKDFYKRITNTIPMRRYCTASEVGDACVFLANSGYVTGTCLFMDGGAQNVTGVIG